MRSMAVQDTQVIVLASDDSPGGKGGLFERFIANLLATEYGFENPRTRSLNVTSDGIELDVVASHKLTGALAIAECKAYTRSVKAAELTNFYGKLSIERFSDPGSFGLMCALPRLTPEGQEKAREIQAVDPGFRYLSGDDLAEILLQAGLITNPPASIKDASDQAVLITEHGVYAACIVLDESERTPVSVATWSTSGAVPMSVLELLQASEYAGGLRVYDAGIIRQSTTPRVRDAPAVLLTEVLGSRSDFEYQLPASPRYFVGRSALIRRLDDLLHANDRGHVLVLNAQSGWGKSSLALKLGDLVSRAKGASIVLDTRTAGHPRYVVEVLRLLALRAEEAGILSLSTTASWASLESALATLRSAEWHDVGRPVAAFFDQFENVFRDVDLTRTFRDLALGARDIPGPFMVGFAWKTDLVGWTEGHPYQLRDDIRSAGLVFVVEPFGPREVDVILRRLAKEAAVRLVPDLRSRLRAYSQGLPWLLKKLADHVLRELRRGVTQEGLLAESLNVVSLFEADLAELNPVEQTVLRHVARFAPIPAAEVTDRFGPDPVQSLVDRRLLVQVGDRLDTYWDTFRDFLNTGSVPVQESWILRQTPRSVGRLLSAVVESGGNASVRELVERLDSSDRAIFNLSRELRLLGVTAHEPNRVKLVDEVLSAQDRESEVRRRVGAALRRHRAYSALRDLAERAGGHVTLESYGRELPNVFPAVAVAQTSWTSYARAFLFWMEYAGLVARQGSEYRPVTEPPTQATVRLLDVPNPLKYRPGVPQIAPGRSLDVLERLFREREIDLPTTQKEREAIGTLVAIGAVTVSPDRKVRLANLGLLDDARELDPPVLRSLLASVPGGQEGLAILEANPRSTPLEVGRGIVEAVHAGWTEETIRSVGGYFRSWARLAGVRVEYPNRRKSSRPAE